MFSLITENIMVSMVVGFKMMVQNYSIPPFVFGDAAFQGVLKQRFL